MEEFVGGVCVDFVGFCYDDVGYFDFFVYEFYLKFSWIFGGGDYEDDVVVIVLFVIFFVFDVLFVVFFDEFDW